MVLKGKEEFVGETLQKFYISKYGKASYKEGGDPPDIYLNLDGKDIPVEISELDENSLQGRKTVDRGYLTYIDNLDKILKLSIPKEIRIFISFYHYNNKVSKINKKFKKYLEKLINNIQIGEEFEDCIDEVCFKIKILKSKGDCRKIIGSTTPFGLQHKKSRDVNIVNQYLSEFSLDEKTKNILLDRISDKNKKCEYIKKPIWLALYDNYYNKFTSFEDDEHIKHYHNIMDEIDDYGIFEKVIIVFQNGDVLEKNT